MTGLPGGWVEAALADLSREISYGFTTKSNATGGGVRLLRITDIQDYNVDWSSLPFCDDQPDSSFLVQAGDIVVARTGATTGKSFLIKNVPAPTAFASYLIRISVSPQVQPEYVWKFMQGPAYWQQIQVVSKGTAQPGANAVILGQVRLSLPPLAEQKRIVAKLDALNSKSARARTELARIETLVSRYKQAVLGKAFNQPIAATGCRFGEYIETAGNGLSKREGDEGEWVNVLRLADLNQGRFAPSEPRQIKLTDKELKRYVLAEGDLVVIRVNGSANLVGRSFCFKAGTPWAFCDHFIRVKLRSSYHPDFAALYINSPAIRSIVERKFVSTSGQKTISQKTLEDLPAPRISLEEQREIVRRIEAAFAKIDRLAVEARRALNLVDKLDEAILTKAFHGELVPQDENDEPASVLLGRIRAERATAPKPKRGRRGVA